jgi:hypothetical protein
VFECLVGLVFFLWSWARSWFVFLFEEIERGVSCWELLRVRYFVSV